MATKLIDFNVNYYVHVRLTDTGRAEHKRQHDELCATTPYNGDYTPPKEDKDGWSKWQMHNLMSTFGHLMLLGLEPPFDVNIKIEVDGS